MDNENTTQDDALQLFNRVIESNQKNIEESIELRHNRDYLLHVHKKSELTMQRVITTLDKAEAFCRKEDEKRQDFLESIPFSIQINLSEKANSQLEHFEKKSTLVKIVFFGMVAVLILATFTAVFNFVFAKQWYSESTKAKSELRQEILDEIKNDGKEIYKVEEVKQLQHNTDMMNKWMQKNPKDAEKFLRFKDGYESR
ncbi:hypothetical protein ACK2M7_08605 [Chryseobacterium sp. TY4]